jgi:hypothetical protein
MMHILYIVPFPIVLHCLTFVGFWTALMHFVDIVSLSPESCTL